MTFVFGVLILSASTVLVFFVKEQRIAPSCLAQTRLIDVHHTKRCLWEVVIRGVCVQLLFFFFFFFFFFGGGGGLLLFLVCVFQTECFAVEGIFCFCYLLFTELLARINLSHHTNTSVLC